MYQNNEYETTKESPNMNGIDLFRNIAGAISLWIGASLITLFELLELICYICLSRSLFGPCKNRQDIYADDDQDLNPPPVVSPEAMIG